MYTSTSNTYITSSEFDLTNLEELDISKVKSVKINNIIIKTEALYSLIKKHAPEYLL